MAAWRRHNQPLHAFLQSCAAVRKSSKAASDTGSDDGAATAIIGAIGAYNHPPSARLPSEGRKLRIVHRKPVKCSEDTEQRCARAARHRHASLGPLPAKSAAANCRPAVFLCVCGQYFHSHRSGPPARSHAALHRGKLPAIGLNRASTSDLDECQLREALSDQQAHSRGLQQALCQAQQALAEAEQQVAERERLLGEERTARRAAEQDAADARWMLQHTDEMLGEAQAGQEAAEQAAADASAVAEARCEAAELAAASAMAATRKAGTRLLVAKKQRKQVAKAHRRERDARRVLNRVLERFSSDERNCIKQASEDASARQLAERRIAGAEAARMQAQLASQRAEQQAAQQAAAAWQQGWAAAAEQQQQAALLAASTHCHVPPVQRLGAMLARSISSAV